MPDEEWLRNLARARFENGEWRLENPSEAAALARNRIADTLATLYDEAVAASEIYNLHGAYRKTLRVLGVKDQPLAEVRGFVLLLGRFQLRVQPAGNAIDASLLAVRDYQSSERLLHRFVPRADALGTVLWLMDNRLLLGAELIIKQLFEDLTRIAHEAGEFAAGGGTLR